MFKFRLLLGVILLLSFAGQASAGPNANATVSIDLIADSGAGNMMDEGVHSGIVAGMGTKIAVEVFAQGVTTPLVGARIEFDFKAAELKLDKVENSAFAFIIPEATGANLAGTAPVTLPESGFLGRAEFSTVADVTDKEFYLGIKSVTLAAGARLDLQDTIAPRAATTSRISFNTRRASDTGGNNPTPPTPPTEAGIINMTVAMTGYTEASASWQKRFPIFYSDIICRVFND